MHARYKSGQNISIKFQITCKHQQPPFCSITSLKIKSTSKITPHYTNEKPVCVCVCVCMCVRYLTDEFHFFP